MLNQLPYDILYKELREEIRSVEKSFQSLQRLYKNLPLSESIKRNFSESKLKQKSAWYACLVNPNIDILLLPEYLESKQSRNILLKKETDQYFKSLDHFDLLGSKHAVELYECILYSDAQNPSSSGVDLFSSQVVESVKCPEALKTALLNWSGKFETFGQLSSIMFEFMEWHKFNQFSFASNRQCLLWLNFRFRQAFGSISSLFNHEHYFYHHWNKESRDMKTSVKELLQNWKKEAEQIKQDLSNLYRNNIAFNHLKSAQKIVANHLFEHEFEIHYPTPVQMSQYPALKPLLKRGFVELSDFGSKENFDKYSQLLNDLLAQNFIMTVKEDEVFISLNPSYFSQKSRFKDYVNINLSQDPIELNAFIEQTITVTKPIQIDEPVQEASVSETILTVPDIKPIRKKAFFG